MTTQKPPVFAHAPSTVRLGDLEVVRLGYGAMRLPGPDIWGEPEDPARAREVLRRVVALGMNLIDSAWYYGPHVSNRLIAETLHPYPKDLVIASKLGGKRLPDKGWAPLRRPEELREGCETDLRELRRDVLDVVHLRYMGKASPVPFAESLDAMIALKKEGKIRHLGLSNVGPGELEFALARTPIVSVQNLYSVSGGADRHRPHDPTPRWSLPSRCSTCARAGELRSCRSSRSASARTPSRALPSPRPRDITAPCPRRSRWRGSWPARPSCSPSRARAGPSTSRRTGRRGPSSSRRTKFNQSPRPREPRVRDAIVHRRSPTCDGPCVGRRD